MTSPLRRWLLVAPLLLGAACGGPQELGSAGATCFRDDECEPGLICVAPVDSTSRVCSNDPTPLISKVDGPPPVEVPMGGAAGMAGAMTVAGGGMGAMAGSAGGAGSANGGSAGAAGSGGSSAGSNSGGTGGSGGTDTAGSGGSGGTDPEGGAPA
ncbi:MAG TPA: hypothetical protein VJN18_08110 [Polyangiaceae bacterium]|nr:hypothetical protein [Polyangiaceae bacterium]